MLHGGALVLVIVLSGYVSSYLQALLLSIFAFGYPPALLGLLSGKSASHTLSPRQWARPVALGSLRLLPAVVVAAGPQWRGR